jgi:hypothetical protein
MCLGIERDFACADRAQLTTAWRPLGEDKDVQACSDIRRRTVSGPEEKLRESAELDERHSTEEIIRLREELAEQVKSLRHMETMAERYGSDISQLATTGREAIRTGICRRGSRLGVDFEPAATEAGGPCLTRPGSRVTAWVIPIDERLLVARRTLAVVGRTPLMRERQAGDRSTSL